MAYAAIEMGVEILVVIHIGGVGIAAAIVMEMAVAHLVAQGSSLILDSVDDMALAEKGQRTEDITFIYSVESILKLGKADRMVGSGYGLRHHHAVGRWLNTVRQEMVFYFGVEHNYF